jgi:hypothetical protein
MPLQQRFALNLQQWLRNVVGERAHALAATGGKQQSLGWSGLHMAAFRNVLRSADGMD